MRVGEELRGALAEVRNLHLGSLTENGIANFIHIHGSKVCEIEEHVVCRSRCSSALLVSEDKINPVVQVIRKTLAHFQNLLLKFRAAMSQISSKTYEKPIYIFGNDLQININMYGTHYPLKIIKY